MKPRVFGDYGLKTEVICLGGLSGYSTPRGIPQVGGGYLNIRPNAPVIHKMLTYILGVYPMDGAGCE